MSPPAGISVVRVRSAWRSVRPGSACKHQDALGRPTSGSGVRGCRCEPATGGGCAGPRRGPDRRHLPWPDDRRAEGAETTMRERSSTQRCTDARITHGREAGPRASRACPPERRARRTRMSSAPSNAHRETRAPTISAPSSAQVTAAYSSPSPAASSTTPLTASRPRAPATWMPRPSPTQRRRCRGTVTIARAVTTASAAAKTTPATTQGCRSAPVPSTSSVSVTPESSRSCNATGSSRSAGAMRSCSPTSSATRW